MSGADERPIARRLEEILERVNSGEMELSRLEGDLGELERRLGDAALDEVDELPRRAIVEERRSVTAEEPRPAVAEVAHSVTRESTSAGVESLSRQIDGLRRHLEHVRALGANTDRKLEALAVAVLDFDRGAARRAQRERLRAAIVAGCVFLVILLSLLAEHTPA